MSVRATQAVGKVLRPAQSVLDWLDVFAADQAQVAGLTTPVVGANGVTVSQVEAHCVLSSVNWVVATGDE